MRVQKKQWLFFEEDNDINRLKAISAEEVEFWLQHLPKILKIGVELEFNLTSKSGMCRGENPDCDCTNAANRCAQECIRASDCLKDRTEGECLNINSPVCTGECDDCLLFLLNCPGVHCIGFQSKCIDCSDFAVNCDVCEIRYDESKDPATARQHIKQELVPTNSWGLPGKHCVAEVTTDGSLRGDKGVEVTTVGRRLEYKSFFEMIKLICDSVMPRGAFVDERTSVHMHFLAGYYRSMNKQAKDAGKRVADTTELERPMPEVILANVHQLFRRYQNALTWMSMGLDQPETMTRWEKYRASILPYSPYFMSMNGIRQDIMSRFKDYGYINYDNCRFTNSGDVQRFHIELRFMDNVPSPSIITAHACLGYAMIMKAVELSRFGLLEVGDNDWSELSQQMKESILNNCPKEFQDNRFSDTSDVRKYERYFKEQGMELLYLVKHTLQEFGPQVYDQLVSLVDIPASFRRIEGHSWKQIEQDFFVPLREEEEINHTVRKVVELRQVLECANLREWGTAVWQEFRNDFPKETNKNAMMRYVKQQIASGKLQWSEPLGTVI